MPLYPNIYALLIGPTGSRKSTAMKIAADLVKRAVPNMNVLPAEGTHQGYARAFRRRWSENTVTADGLILASEYGVLVSKERHKSELPKWLTDWYDCPDRWSRALSQEEYYELENLYLCSCGASNMAWLKDIPDEAIKGGFLPRHLLFDAPDRRHRNAIPRFDGHKSNSLVEMLSLRTSTIPEHIAFDMEAEAYIHKWYEGDLADAESKVEDEQILAWYSRKLAHVIKMATVWQIVDGGPMDSIRVDWLDKARRVVDWCDGAVARIYGKLGVTDEGAATEDILGLLQRNGGKLPQYVIQRKLRNKYTKARVIMGLDTLRAARLANSEATVAHGTVWELRK